MRGGDPREPARFNVVDRFRWETATVKGTQTHGRSDMNTRLLALLREMAPSGAICLLLAGACAAFADDIQTMRAAQQALERAVNEAGTAVTSGSIPQPLAERAFSEHVARVMGAIDLGGLDTDVREVTRGLFVFRAQGAPRTWLAHWLLPATNVEAHMFGGLPRPCDPAIASCVAT